MPLSARRRLVATLIALGSLAACTLLNPLDEYESGSGTHADAGDAGEGGADGAEGGCKTSRWPPRPTSEDGAEDVEVVQALVSFTAERDPDAGTGVVDGYDLDGVCTCPEPESCKGTPEAPVHCDDPGGVDNSGGELLSTVASLVDRKASIDQRLQSGDYGLVFRVRGYNGGANDQRVEVSVFLSNGAEGIEDGGVPPKPRYDGNDAWTVDPASLVGGKAPPYLPNFVDSNAYVSDHVLVATVDFAMRIGRMTVQLSGSVVTGTLVKDAVGWHVDDGRIAGRVATRAFLTNLAAIDDPLVADAGLCGDSGTYQDAKTKICEATDVTTDLKQDNTGAPCDALAVNARFTSSSAKLGSVFGLPPPAQRCGPQWVDDCPK